MGCFHPLTAYKSLSKNANNKSSITFKRPIGHLTTELQLPCGQCSGCRLERSRQWAIRCNHEASLYANNSFITLTYNDDHLPSDGCVNVQHFQLFLKRLRKKFIPKNPYDKKTQKQAYEKFHTQHQIRFYHCGEYGDNLSRPHYHALLFNFDFLDKQYHKKTNSGDILYTSQTLDDLWGKGHCYVGTVTFESSAYVARYIMKKINGKGKNELNEKGLKHYERLHPTNEGEIIELTPEYTTMSRRPGIGKRWWDKYKQDVYPSEEVIIKKGNQNIPVPPPKYYENLYELDNPVQHQIMKERNIKTAKENAENNTPERLKVRETICQSRLKQLKRELHDN